MEHETHDDDGDGLKDSHDDDGADDEDDYDGDVDPDDANEEENTGDDGCKFFRLGNSAAQLISPPQQTMQLHTWNKIQIQIQIHDNSGKAV